MRAAGERLQRVVLALTVSLLASVVPAAGSPAGFVQQESVRLILLDCQLKDGLGKAFS